VQQEKNVFVLYKMINNNIVYHEGGDSYRPFIIIELPPNLWVTPNISFYRTTGRSNEGFSIYSNTWFPTPGLITTEVKLKDIDTSFTKGHIIKCAMLGRKYKEWHKNLIRSFLLSAYAYEISRELEYINTVEFLFDRTKTIASYPIYFMKPDELKLEKMYFLKKIIQYVVMLYDLLSIYFYDDWQLKLSCKLGGGIWKGMNSTETHINEMLSRFRKFVDNNINLPNEIRIPNIKSIPSTEEELQKKYALPETNENAVISFLETNHAQISHQDLVNINTNNNSNIDEVNQENSFLYSRNHLLLNTIDNAHIKKITQIIEKKKNIISPAMAISREPTSSSSPPAMDTKTQKRKSSKSPRESPESTKKPSHNRKRKSSKSPRESPESSKKTNHKRTRKSRKSPHGSPESSKKTNHKRTKKR